MKTFLLKGFLQTFSQLQAFEETVTLTNRATKDEAVNNFKDRYDDKVNISIMSISEVKQ